MAKFYGKVGFSVTSETEPGVYTKTIEERAYTGDILRRSWRYPMGVSVNNDITIQNEISILADPYAYKNFSNIEYVEFMHTKWQVSSVEVEYPRLILSIGGVYNAG